MSKNVLTNDNCNGSINVLTKVNAQYVERRKCVNTISCIYDYSRLRGKIREILGTEGEFAKAINRSHCYVSAVFNGKAYFNPSDMDNIAEVLSIPLEEYGIYFFTRIVDKSQ